MNSTYIEAMNLMLIYLEKSKYQNKNLHPLKLKGKIMHRQPHREVKYDDVPCFAISGFFGGLNPNEAHVSFFQDHLVPQIGQQPGQIVLDTVEHKFVATIKMSPAVFKRMMLWMGEHVKRYEQQHGEINIGPQNVKQEQQDQPAYYG